MKVWPGKYHYDACPHCKSKKIKPVSMTEMGTEYVRSVAQIHKTGNICSNCKRYFQYSKTGFIYDRAEMRRDIKRLQKFLAGE